MVFSTEYGQWTVRALRDNNKIVFNKLHCFKMVLLILQKKKFENRIEFMTSHITSMSK